MNRFTFYETYGGKHDPVVVNPPTPFHRSVVAASLHKPAPERERGLLSGGWYLGVDEDYIPQLQAKHLIEPEACTRCGRAGKVFHLREPWYKILVQLTGEGA